MWVIESDQYLGEVPAWNRAWQFGDGLYETLKVKDGKISALNLHVKRMEKGCAVLNLQLPPSGLESLFTQQVSELVKQSKLQDAAVKVIARRQDSNRGYGYQDNSAVFTFMLNPLPNYVQDIYEQGITAQWCDTQCSMQKQLAGLKHLNRLENVLAKKELDASCFEGLMCNAQGNVIEGTMSNVFMESDGKLHTPKLDVSGIAGVMREQVLQYCQANHLKVTIKDITPAEVESADGLFVCNSLMGIVPITNLKDRNNNKQEYKIGALTKSLMAACQKDNMEGIDE